MLYIKEYDSPLGVLTLAANEQALLWLCIEGQRYFMEDIKYEKAVEKENDVLQKTNIWLYKYFNNERPSPYDLPIAPQGSAFRKRVWEILCDIPYGSVVTYGDIAHKLAAERGIVKMAAQAVGGAVGHNPISIVIPCHRVVGTGGDLTGYGGGINIKKKLLAHEGLDMRKFHDPKKHSPLNI